MLSLLVDSALEAGEVILKIYQAPDTGLRTKHDGSPVTDADAEAEKLILARLRAAYPETPIVAEEEMAAGASVRTERRFFLVDPLDGTKEFVNRNGDFTVNIALIEDGRPVCGVVYAPAHGLLYAGAEGEGARMAHVEAGHAGVWRNIVTRTPPGEGLAVIASRSHMSPETDAFLAKFKVAHLVSAGSSLKFCRVATGEADLYPRLGRTMEWDTAAGDAVLRAAGGRVYTMKGEPLRYGKRDQDDDSDYANPWFVAAGQINPFQA